jgi:hypothetical protein
METYGLVVIASLVVRVVKARPIQAVVATRGTRLLVRVFKGTALGARSAEVRVFNALENVPR